jgi:hypothetical protein
MKRVTTETKSNLLEVRRAAFEFNQEQRSVLAECGWLPEQVEELQRRLPFIRAWQQRPPSKSEIRKRLQAISKPLKDAIAALDALEGSAFPDGGPEGPSLDRIVLPHMRSPKARELPGAGALAAFDRLNLVGEDVAPLHALVERLEKVESEVMAEGQSRYYVSWRPIYEILRAHKLGWQKHHKTEDLIHKGEGPHEFKPFPRYQSPVVQNYNRENPSTFDRVAKVCQEVAEVHTSPDKAIRKWLAREDDRIQQSVEGRKLENDALPEGEKYRPIDLLFTPRQRFGKRSTTAGPKK